MKDMDDYVIHCDYKDYYDFETIIDNAAFDLLEGKITAEQFVDIQIKAFKEFSETYSYNPKDYRCNY